MTISISKEPEGIYPAYNDSFIEFSSDLADNNKAEITVEPTEIFTRVFVLYPDADGNYLFNLKEAVKVIFNQDGFKDANFFTDAYWKSISGLYLSQDITIKVLSDIDEEEIPKTYEFFKAVKQIGESIIDNPFQILTYTLGGIDHYLTYFEGFPFSFDIQRVIYVEGKVLNVKSLNSGITSEDMDVTATGAFRMNVDRSDGKNWTFDNVLPLIEGLNRLEIHEDTVFKVNVLLTKKKKCSGVYLKWFNRDGGFSHFLFDAFYNELTTGANIDVIQSTEFNNIESKTGNFKSTGKEAQRVLRIKASYDAIEYQVLKDILISPFVQMYTSQEANVSGKFIDVNIEGSLNYANKRGFNKAILSVDLPEVITAKL